MTTPTTTFAELEAAAPAIGRAIRARIEATGLSFVATTRSDGWPRVSGWELFVCEGRLYVGSMPNAVKVQDLRRDPRCCVVTTLADKDDTSGEGKLFCVAREIVDADEWETARKTFQEIRDFDMGPPGGGHLFELAVHGAAWQRVEDGDHFRTSSWVAGQPVRERQRTGALGESEELT